MSNCCCLPGRAGGFPVFNKQDTYVIARGFHGLLFWDTDLDKIDLTALGLANLDIVGVMPFSGGGTAEMRFTGDTVANRTTVWIDLNGNGDSDMSFQLVGITTFDDDDLIIA